MAEKDFTESPKSVRFVETEVELNSSGAITPCSELAKDGETSWLPKPSIDPDDPLNWSWLKKHTVLAAILPGCFLTDWTLTWGATLFVPQAVEWHMSVPDVSNSISGGIFMQGPGGLLAVPLCQRYGRLPVLFWCQFLSLVSTIGATLAPTYAGFTACRTLQGFFGAPPQVIGLSIIYDLFFWHEHARKINIWAFCYLTGPYLGPFISGLIVEKEDWRNTFGILCGFYGFSLLCIVAFGDETLYNRDDPQPRAKGLSGRLQKLSGISGYREAAGRPTMWQATKDLLSVILRPYLLLPTFGVIMFSTMWAIGVVSTISIFVLPPPYLFTETAFALLFLAPLIGTLLAEFWGHWFNDYLSRRYLRTHSGLHKPEHRLWGVYPPWVLGIGGLVLFGQAFQHQLHWVAIAFGWGLIGFGTLGTTTAVASYILDVFAMQAAAASAWILMARVAGGFSVTYFQSKWVAADGPGVVFGSQAGILGAAVLSIITLQVFGEKMRKNWPVPVAVEH